MTPVHSKHMIAVAGIDEREYLRRGEITPDYLGMTRGTYGNPFLVKTASKQPLALEVAQILASSFGSKSAGPAIWVPNSDMAFSRLKNSSASRISLIRILTWESDTLIRTSLDYSLSLEIYDRSGQLLASASETKSQTLGGNAAFPVMHARQSVLRELSLILDRLVNENQIQSAIQNN